MEGKPMTTATLSQCLSTSTTLSTYFSATTIPMYVVNFLLTSTIIIIIIIITSGQSDLTTGRIAAAHGQFNGIQQVAPVCTST